MTRSVTHSADALPVSAVRLLRASLVAVWQGTEGGTALTHRTQGEALLPQAGLTDSRWIKP